MTGVLVTRPAHQAAAQADALTQKGYTPILAPCLKLKLERGPRLDDAGIAAYAVTSANGVTALAARLTDRAKTLYVVGAATEAAARAAGFADIVRGGGDAAALTETIAGAFDPTSGALLYACGEDTAFDLRAPLEEHGIVVLQVALYAMPLVASLPATALRAIDAKEAAAVLLMSARTAAAFGDLVEAAGRSAALGSMAAICLSPAVATVARGYPFGEVVSALEPTQDALLAALEAHRPAL